jgi:hypothetical protein
MQTATVVRSPVDTSSTDSMRSGTAEVTERVRDLLCGNSARVELRGTTVTVGGGSGRIHSFAVLFLGSSRGQCSLLVQSSTVQAQAERATTKPGVVWHDCTAV